MAGFTNALGKIGHMNMRTYTQCATSTLRFQSASNNLIGLLTVGAVIGTGVTITDYVIEWRLGSITGAIQLVSGVGSDPDIQAFHPLVSEPVVGGTLYAVIRYIVINGIRYSPYFRQGQYSPDLKACLGSVTVQNITCSNGISGNYSHIFSYTNNLSPANNAERTLRLDLNSDGSTHFIAWQFNGQYVADQLTISYVVASDPDNPIILSNWIIGANATTNFTSNPKVFGSGYQTLKNVLGITQTYQAGDYLLIHITPRVLEPFNSNTNWSLYLKCLSAFDTTTTPDNARDFDFSTFTMVWNSTSCQWNLHWRYIGNYTTSSQMATYLQLGSYSAYAMYGGNIADSGGYFRKSVNAQGSSINYTNANCLNISSPTTVQKSGSTCTFTFTDTTEYNRFKTKYNTVNTNSHWTDYSSDDSNINHFKYFNIIINIGSTCGDTFTQKTLAIFITSTFTWDDSAKTLVLNLATPTSSIPNVACNNSYSTINSLITAINNNNNQADFNVTTSISVESCLFGVYYYLITLDETYQSITYGIGIPNQALVEGWTAPSEWLQQYYWNMFGILLIRAALQITNNADPANNYRVSDYMNPDGTVKQTPVIVYEMENGVQIIP
jgi:hypothetical protein